MRMRRDPDLTDSAYVELVRSLVSTLAPTTIMGGLFMIVASLAVARFGDTLLTFLGVAGGVASLARVAVTLLLDRRMADGEIEATAARRLERLFAASYLTFAVLLGAFAARVMQVSDPQVQTVVAALTVGYAAGVAAGIALRPWISVPALLTAVIPPAAVSALSGDLTHAVLALVLLALLAGGLGSMVRRYRSEIEKIAMRHAFASLARTDHLTGLLNRFALGEAFDQARQADGSIALHCVDLDGFKPVNDTYGHPTGDKLLIQVADRLKALCRSGDVAARLGGDEFVLVRRGIEHASEADLLGRRIARSLGRPYEIEGRSIRVGASVGSAVGAKQELLSDVLGMADRDLYRVKRRRRAGAEMKSGTAQDVQARQARPGLP